MEINRAYQGRGLDGLYVQFEWDRTEEPSTANTGLTDIEAIPAPRILTAQELELLKECKGVHATVSELFACKSCDVMFQD